MKLRNGYIKVSRELLGSRIFGNEKLLKVWMWCLLKAAHKEHEQMIGMQKVLLRPGQFVFGRKKAAFELGFAESTVWRLMKQLKTDNSLDIKTNNKYSVITLINWGFYQGTEENADSKADNKINNRWTANEQQVNNRWTTDEQQMDTNKNEKNVKNEKNEEKEKNIVPDGETHGLTDQTTNGSQEGLPLNTGAVSPRQTRKEAKQQYAPFVHMQESEYEALIERTGGEAQAKRCIEILDNYKGSTGKKYKDDYRAICSWVLDRLRDEQERYSKQRAPGNPQVEMALRAIDMLDGVATKRLDWL